MKKAITVIALLSLTACSNDNEQRIVKLEKTVETITEYNKQQRVLDSLQTIEIIKLR